MRGLNPFEIRALFKSAMARKERNLIVSIPLKSGHCLNDGLLFAFELDSVSIPLKSGHCLNSKTQKSICNQSVSDMFAENLHGFES